jgi:hypothetical protein
LILLLTDTAVMVRGLVAFQEGIGVTNILNMAAVLTMMKVAMAVSLCTPFVTLADAIETNRVGYAGTLIFPHILWRHNRTIVTRRSYKNVTGAQFLIEPSIFTFSATASMFQATPKKSSRITQII